MKRSKNTVVSQNNKVVTGALIAKIGYTSSYNLVLLKDYKFQNNNKANFVKAMMILDAKLSLISLSTICEPNAPTPTT